MADLIFQKLPFDILYCIFEELDTKSLARLCLVSRSVNELASPVLYRTVTWGLPSWSPWGVVMKKQFQILNRKRNQPVILAFHRRPWLRSSVRVVILTYSLNGTDSFAQESLRHICHQLSLLPSVVRLEWRIADHLNKVPSMRFSLFLPIMKRMESLQEVVFPDISGKVDAPAILMRRLKRVGLYAKNIQAPSPDYSPSLLPAGSNLEALAVRSIMDSADFLRAFRHLSTLNLGLVKDPARFISTIRSMSQLHELRVEISSFHGWHTPMPDSLQLCHLRHLSIGVIGTTLHRTFVPSVRQFYECLASGSKSLQAARVYLPGINCLGAGDKLLRDIVRFHGAQIRSIRLDEHIISPQSLLVFSLYCPHLEELAFCLNIGDDSLIRRLSMLKAVFSLEILRITIYEHRHMPSEREVKTFMIQEMNRLRRLYLRLISWGRIMHRLWESQWIYDPEYGASTRIISESREPSE